MREISAIDYNRYAEEEKKQDAKEYIWLYHGKAEPLPEGKIKQQLQERDIEAACIGEAYQEELSMEELSMEELLLDERHVKHGIIIEKSLLQAVGGINTRLQAKWEYELILRVCLVRNVAVIPFDMVCRGVLQEDVEDNWSGFCTDAYVAGRYSSFLQENGLFAPVMEALLEEAASSADPKAAQELLEEMISHTGRYHHYYDATQPILIYLGPTYCYNILNVFARELGKAFKRQGQPVEFYDTEKEDINGIAALAGKRYKASIGFQTWLMSVKRKDREEYFQDMIGGPKYNFIVDHPIWLHDQLIHVPKRFYVLTHDRTYQDFISRYYKGVTEAYLLPPGGRIAMAEKAETDRRYDITFLGTYGDYRKKLQVIRACVRNIKFLAARYLLYMTRNPDITAETAFGMALEYYGMDLGQEELLSLFGEMKAVIQCVMYYYREKVIREILGAGYTVHVYGASWEGSPLAGHDCLQIHPEIAAERSAEVLQASKISLNVMAWHKDGFTERIADSMLAGAVVVSDKSTQLEEQYHEETVLYDLGHLEELPRKIGELLDDSEKRRQLTERAREKAIRYATWDVRAKELLDIIEKEVYFRI